MTELCTGCRKPWDAGPCFFTLKKHPDGRQEEVFVCAGCKSIFGTNTTLFTELYVPAGKRGQRPPFWHNDKPLYGDQALNPLQMPLRDYPLIEDFELLVDCWDEPQSLTKEGWHYALRFTSPSRGYLTSILEGDFQRSDFVLPRGTFDKPYHLAGGWDTLDTLIAENNGFVYILTDNRDFMLTESGNRVSFYSAWFKVDKDRYYNQWEQAIYLINVLSARQKQ
jgi:hypothetical protein